MTHGRNWRTSRSPHSASGFLASGHVIRRIFRNGRRWGTPGPRRKGRCGWSRGMMSSRTGGNGRRLVTKNFKTKGWSEMTVQLALADLPETDMESPEIEFPQSDAESSATESGEAAADQPLEPSPPVELSPGSAEAVGVAISAELATPAATCTAGDNMAELNAADPVVVDPTAAELIALRREIDRLTSELSMRKFSDREISNQSARVRELSDEVRDCESAVKEAKGELTATKERYESAVRELRSMLDDRGRGQKRFPLVAETAAVSGSPLTAVDSGQLEHSKKSVSQQILDTAAAAINSGAMDAPGLTVTATVGSGELAAAATSASALKPDEHASSAISVLAQKQMIALFGQDAWEAAKNREEPFGMGKAELEALEAAEIATIGDLEKKMREDAWWHEKLPKFGEKKVAKLIESLRVWRTKFPMPE